MLDTDVEIQKHYLFEEVAGLDIELYDWQKEALVEWMGRGSRGIIEAVTGAGKTRVGIAAAQLALNRGFEVLVIAPTKDLVHQWHSELTQILDSAVGIAGDGRSDWFDEYDVIVATVHTAKNYRDRPARYQRLLVADEVHRYASEGWSLALTEYYEWRIGLTATYARPDGMHAAVLDPYFDGLIFQLWYDRALREGLIAEFDIGFVSVRLTTSEEREYSKIEESRESFYRNLRRYLDRDPGPQKLMEIVNAWADSPGFEPQQRIARGYRAILQKRRQILAESESKIEALRVLGGAVLDAQGTLVFTDTQASARHAAAALTEVGSHALAVYSDLVNEERERAIEDFRQGAVSAVAAPRILDEGIDVPEADLGILLAMNRSRRQLVQRLGRVLRRKPDGRHARILVLCAQGTHEDPRYVGPSKLEHLEEILKFARRLRYFNLEHDKEDLLDFLRGIDGGEVLPLAATGTEEVEMNAELPEEVTGLRATVTPQNEGRVPNAHQLVTWLLRSALREKYLRVGELLYCNREKIRDFGTITLEASGDVYVETLATSKHLVAASRDVVGYRLPVQALLKSWVTAGEVSLMDIWEQIKLNLPDEAPKSPLKDQRKTEASPELQPHREAPNSSGTEDVSPPEETPPSDVSPKSAEPAETRLQPSGPSPVSTGSFPPQPRLTPSGTAGREQEKHRGDQRSDEGLQAVAVELRPGENGPTIVIRPENGPEIQLVLASAAAGALGAQLQSAAFQPLQHPYGILGKGRVTPGSQRDVADKIGGVLNAQTDALF